MYEEDDNLLSPINSSTQSYGSKSPYGHHKPTSHHTSTKPHHRPVTEASRDPGNQRDAHHDHRGRHTGVDSKHHPRGGSRPVYDGTPPITPPTQKRGNRPISTPSVIQSAKHSSSDMSQNTNGNISR